MKVGGHAIQRWREQLIARYHAKRRHTARHEKQLVLIVGPDTDTAAQIVAHALRETGNSVAYIENDIRHAGELHLAIAHAQRKHPSHIVFQLPYAYVAEGMLGGVSPAVVVLPAYETTPRVLQMQHILQPAHIIYGLLSNEEPLEDNSDSYVSFSTGNTTDAIISQIKEYRMGTELTLTIDHQVTCSLATYLIGERNIPAVAASVCCLYGLHQPLEKIDDIIADFIAPAANFEYLALDTPYTVIVDETDNEQRALVITQTAAHLAKRRLILIVHATAISKEAIDQLREITERLIVVDVNDLTREIPGVERVVSPDAAYRKVVQVARRDDTVLFCGGIFAIQGEDNQYACATGIIHAQRGNGS